MRKIKLDTYTIENAWLISAKTFLVDSAVPSCEQILLPPATTVKGELTINILESETQTQPKTRSRKSHYKYFLKSIFQKPLVMNGFGIDLRRNSPENWAHSFTNHLPIALLLRSEMPINIQKQIFLILPTKISKNIIRLFESFKFNVLITDDIVACKLIDYDISPWWSVRGVRYDIINSGTIDNKNLIRNTEKYRNNIPDKIFISRKDSRKIVNESDISRYLESLGFVKLYLEEYDVFHQISFLLYAKHIVAVHGAALGPLILRPPDENFELVEIFTPSHVTTCFRVITSKIGGKWIGVRGQTFSGIRDLEYVGNIKKYEAYDFFVDIDSLKLALNIINKEQPDYP